MPFENQDTIVTIPEGAGPGERRIVIGVQLPPPLDTYLFNSTSTFDGAILFRQESDDEFLFIGLVNNTVAPEIGLTIVLGGVRNGVVVEDNPGEPSGGSWFFTASDFVGHRHRGGSVTFPHVRIVGGEFDAFLVIETLNGILWNIGTSFFLKNNIQGDLIARWFLQSTGEMFWGDGQVTADCFILRDGVQQLLIGPKARIPDGIDSARMRFKEDGRVGTDTTEPGTTPVALTVTNGMTFIAPPSGIVEVTVQAELRLELTVASGKVMYMGYQLRTGGTIGSGTIVQPALDRHAAAAGIDGPIGATTRDHGYASSMTFGLAPGNTYNVRCMKWLSSAGGCTVQYIDPRIIVRPSP